MGKRSDIQAVGVDADGQAIKLRLIHRRGVNRARRRRLSFPVIVRDVCRHPSDLLVTRGTKPSL